MKKILVTGASSGIGKEICKKAIDQGYSVVGVARNFDKFNLCHPHFTTYPVDLSNLKTLPKKLQKIAAKEGFIEILILNAGRGLFGYLEQLAFEAIESLVSLNFLSAAFVTKAFLPQMKQRQTGTLIFIGSEASLEGKTQGSIYCASKFALRGFSQSIRKECAKSGIRVSLINPGFVKTPFFDQLHFSPTDQESNYCLPEEIAALVMEQISVRPALVYEEINVSPIKSQVVQKNKLEDHLKDSKTTS